MQPIKICERDIETSIKMVIPKLIRADLTKYRKNIKNVAQFLVDIKGNRRKWFLTMSVDYFNCLLKYYQEILKLEGFRLMHIDTEIARELYKKFLEERGSLYWNGIVKDSSITTDSGIFHQEIDAENINVEQITEKLKEQFEKPIIRGRKGV